MVEISVVVPVYNVEEYLSECLDSVIGQSFEDIEIICIDDGSTDSSLDILNEYSKKEIESSPSATITKAWALPAMKELI